MKALFLDIDGVLNSAEYLRERRHLPRPTPHAIDAPTIPRLNAITDRTGAKIVVSSSWRAHRHPHDPTPTARMARILAAHGATGEVIGVTPSLRGSPRGREIRAWLIAHSDAWDAFAILDDKSDMDGLDHMLVKTKYETGLLDEHVELVCELLAEG